VIAGAAELARFSYLNSRNVSGRIYVVCNGTNADNIEAVLP
jgi:hypothetical protein